MIPIFSEVVNEPNPIKKYFSDEWRKGRELHVSALRVALNALTLFMSPVLK